MPPLKFFDERGRLPRGIPSKNPTGVRIRGVEGGGVYQIYRNEVKLMASTTDLSKQERIKKEQRRLRTIFKDLEQNKKKLVTPLIDKAAFMSIELDELQDTIEADGWISEYKNGENQYGTKRSPEADTYIALSKNYAAVIKQLVDLVPEPKRKASKLAALRDE